MRIARWKIEIKSPDYGLQKAYLCLFVVVVLHQGAAMQHS
jgi:hypothetical protein